MKSFLPTIRYAIIGLLILVIKPIELNASTGIIGMAVANPNNICVAGNVQLSLSGVQTGWGRCYQWQKSSNNFSWTNLSGVNGTTASVNVNSTTWFRCIVSFAGNSNPTQSVMVLFNNTLISNFPHNENFDGSGNSLPCGWSIQNVNHDTRTWKSSASNSKSAPRNIRYIGNNCQQANDWLFTPGFKWWQALNTG